MGLFLLLVVHTTFALAFFATALVAVRGFSNPWARRAVVALAFVPLAALHGLIAVKMGLLRFDLGIEHAPWLWAAGLLVAHVAGAIALRARVRHAAWSLPRTALVAIVALAADATTIHVLALDGRFLGLSMQLDAGRAAYALTPSRPAPGENAAPLYEALRDEIAALHDDESADAWMDALNSGDPIDAGAADLEAYLARAAGLLDRIRAATELPRCAFAPTGEDDVVHIPSVMPFLHASDLLRLSARVRVAEGDVAGAASDVSSAFALSSHLVETPSVLTLMMASVLRSRAIDELELVLSAPRLSQGDVDALVLPAAPLDGELERGLRMEEAFMLSVIGRALASDGIGILGGSGDAWTAIDDGFFLVLLARSEVRGLREGFAALRQHAAAGTDMPLDDVVRRGVLTRLALPNLRSRTATLRQGDARLELARAAIAATRWKLEHGEYPREIGAWCGTGAPLRIEGDGVSIALTHTGSFPEPVVLRLPVESR